MNLWFDLKYAWRLATKSWGYSLMCASVVALGVGLAVWTYTIVYSQVWKPLTFPGAERWYSVQLIADNASRPRPGVDAYTWQELLKQNRSADVLGAFASQPVVLSEGQASTTLRASLITPGLFAAYRGAPLLGRVLSAADAQSGAAAVAVLSYSTWQDYFAADPKIVGKTARIDATPVRIVGVMPKEFFALQDHELWMPLQTSVLARPRDSTMTLFPFIQLRGGQSIESLTTEMQAAIKRVNGDYPDQFNAARRVMLIPGHRTYSYNSGPIVTTLGFMAVAVLLLGCMNISMVFLAGLLERSREIALRTALGAARPRLLRQCLLETALIVLAGLVGGYGLVLAGMQYTRYIGDLMTRVLATGRGSGTLPTLHAKDVIVAVAIAIVVWLLSTLIPAWRISRQDAAVVLAGSGKGATIRGSNRTVGILVGLQVIISCLVLVTCGNVVLACYTEVSKPSGLVPSQVSLTTYPTVFSARYAEGTERVRYWDNLAAAIQSKIPGTTVAYMTTPPTRPVRVSAALETRQERRGTFTVPLTVVSENYFDALGIRLRAGRLFERTDDRNSLDVAVVDEQFITRYWPGQNVLGKRVQLNPSEGGRWLTIVGVVSGVSGRPWRDEDAGVIYQPLRQDVPKQFHVMVKLPNTSANTRVALRAAAFEVDRDLPLHNPQTLDDYRKATNMNAWSLIPVMIVIALITAVLAASGLFGLISRSVAQRTQEVGIRRALGATVWRSTSMFLRQGAVYLTVAFAGLGLGVIIMPLLSRAIPNILESVVPVTAAVVLLMAAVISIASYLPTRRAVALQPGDALHYE